MRPRKSACYSFGHGTRHFLGFGAYLGHTTSRWLASLLANGYRTEARIIAHIAEVEERKLHAKDGSPSLFQYCVVSFCTFERSC
jgi:hypothetical protein